MLSSPSSPSFPNHHPYRLGRPTRLYSKNTAASVLREPRDFDIFQHLDNTYGLDPFYAIRSRRAMQLHDYYHASKSFFNNPSSSALSRPSTASSTRSGRIHKSNQPIHSPIRSLFRSHDDNQSTDAESVKNKRHIKPPFPLSSSRSPLPSHPRRQFDEDSRRSSLDSVSTATTFQTQPERKVKGKVMTIPPPLKLVKSNLHPKRHETSATVEIIPPSPPPSDTRLPTLQSPTSPDSNMVVSPSPTTPSFLPIPEEKVRERQLDKVMRTLGERVPPELILSSAAPLSSSNSPSPSIPYHSPSRETGLTTSRLARHASLTLSSFPATVSSTLGHARHKSREILGLIDPDFPTPKPQKQLPNIVMPPDEDFPYNTFAKPGNTIPVPVRGKTPSPILFPDMSKPIPPPPLSQYAEPTPLSADYETESFPTPKRATRAERLANRASISTSVILPGSPFHQRFTDSARDNSLHSPSSQPQDDPDTYILEAWMPLSPLVCAERVSFQLVVDEADPVEDEELPFSPSKNPSSLNLDDSKSHSKMHLPLHLRPDGPFLWNGELTPPLKSPSRTSLDSVDPVVRRERRQGWSGEWNRADMQDVISKLRNLK